MGSSNFQKLSRLQLERHIRSVAAKDTASVVFSSHAEKMMRTRRVLDTEVRHCLRRGRIEIAPEEDMKTGHLICRMQCYGASKNLAVCVALDDDDPSMIVVTVIVK